MLAIELFFCFGDRSCRDTAIRRWFACGDRCGAGTGVAKRAPGSFAEALVLWLLEMAGPVQRPAPFGESPLSFESFDSIHCAGGLQARGASRSTTDRLEAAA